MERTLTAPTLIATLLLFCSTSVLAAPDLPLINVPNADSLSQVSYNGELIWCLAKGSKHLAGTPKQNNKKFLSLKAKTQNKVANLQLKIAAASTAAKKKKFKDKITELKAILKEQNAACSGDDGGTPPNPENWLEPLDRKPTDADVRYLVEKAGFGFGSREQYLSSLKSSGVSAVVDAFMSIRTEDSGFQAEFDNWLDGTLENEEELSVSFEGVRRAWTYAMQKTNNPFRERLALWLLGLWTVNQDVIQNDQARLLNDYINGNPSIPLKGIRGYARAPQMREMALNMSKSALMLIFLDGASNIKTSPNENFARELLELFTTSPENLDGTPNYTEDGDIVKAAAALTGWRVANGNRGFSPGDQDTRTFVMFQGTGHDCTVSQNGQGKMDQLINCIFDRHPNVAIYYAQEMLREYLTPNPPRALIEALATVIKQNNFNLDPAFKQLLSSKIFYANAYRDTVAKNSAEFAVETVRTLNIPVDADDLENWINKMGMPLTQSPTVFWFPDSTWTSAPVKIEALNFLSSVVEDRYSDAGWLPQQILPTGTATPATVVQMAGAKLGVATSSDQVAQLTYFMNHYRNWDGTFVENEYNNSDTQHQRERGLGVYQILGMSIPYQMK